MIPVGSLRVSSTLEQASENGPGGATNTVTPGPSSPKHLSDDSRQEAG